MFEVKPRAAVYILNFIIGRWWHIQDWQLDTDGRWLELTGRLNLVGSCVWPSETWNKTVYRCTMFSATNDVMLVSLSGRCKFPLIPMQVTHFSPQHSQSTSRWLILLFCLQLSSAHKKLLTLSFSRWTSSRHQGTGSIDEEHTVCDPGKVTHTKF